MLTPTLREIRTSRLENQNPNALEGAIIGFALSISIAMGERGSSFYPRIPIKSEVRADAFTREESMRAFMDEAGMSPYPVSEDYERRMAEGKYLGGNTQVSSGMPFSINLN